MIPAILFCVALFTTVTGTTPYHMQCIELHERPSTIIRWALDSIRPWDRFDVVSHSIGTETSTGLTTITLEIVPLTSISGR